MNGYCVMVIQPFRSQVFITGPFFTVDRVKRWIAENGKTFPEAEFKIAWPEWKPIE